MTLPLRTAVPTGRRPLPRLGERFDPGSNALNLLRFLMATAVLVAHAAPIGYGQPGLGQLAAATDTQLNKAPVYGFLVISGYLIAGSGLHQPLARFTWVRFLRVFPGLWACLLVTALVFAPLLAWYENGDLTGFWSHPEGPLRHLWVNWFTSMEQYGISGLLVDTPYGRLTGGSVFNGSLWSIKYELLCYALIGVLACVGVLRRRPRLVLALTGFLFLVILVASALTADRMPWPLFPGAVGPFPLLGSVNVNQSVYLTYVFLLGASLRLYQHRLPVSGALAAVATVLAGVSLFTVGFVVVGLPALAYLVCYLAVALPVRLHTVGRRRDYSYGTYLYSFPVQQALAAVGFARWGMVAYLVLSFVGTVVLAILSWHLVEGPAMRLKNWRPARNRWREPDPPALARTGAVD